MNIAELTYELNKHIKESSVIQNVIDYYKEFADENRGFCGIDTDSLFTGIYEDCSSILNEYAKNYLSNKEIEDDAVCWEEYFLKIEEDLSEWRKDICGLIRLNFDALGFEVYKLGDIVAIDGKYETVRSNMFIIKKYVLDDVMTFSEAAKLYELEDSTLRKAVDRFRPYEVKKSGGTWLVTKEAMERLY